MMLSKEAREIIEREIAQLRWDADRAKTHHQYLLLQADILQLGLDEPEVQRLFDDGWKVPSGDKEQR